MDQLLLLHGKGDVLYHNGSWDQLVIIILVLMFVATLRAGSLGEEGGVLRRLLLKLGGLVEPELRRSKLVKDVGAMEQSATYV